MGIRCSCISNQILPLEESHPKVVTGNFVRGRGDGESDTEKSKEHSPKLSRHVSGSSFSSKSCASRSVDDLQEEDDELPVAEDDDDDLLAYLNTNNRGSQDLISRYDMLSEVASDVKTEGGLTDVALDLDHPFAPLYEGDELTEANLSRPRSVGLRGRSSYTRDLLSQLSNYSDIDSPGPVREDTPVPGKRGGSSVLSKRKHGKKRGSNTSRSKKSYYHFNSMLQREDSDAYTPRSYRESTPGSFSDRSSFTIRTDDGGSSLSSSTSSLSAIGEMSESGSVKSDARPSHSGNRPSDERLYHAGSSNSFNRGSTPNKQPRMMQQEYSRKRQDEIIPPVPAPRPSKKNSRSPRSADIVSCSKEVEQSGNTPKSADLLLRQDSSISRSLVERKDSTSSKRFQHDSTLSRSLVREDTKMSVGRSTGNYNNLQNGYSKMADFSYTPTSSSAWNELRLPLQESNRRNQQYSGKKRASSGFVNNGYLEAGHIKPTSASYGRTKAEEVPWMQERPMAARPRRPATAAEENLNYQKTTSRRRVDDILNDELMDEESHPDLSQDDKFRTIIII